MNNHSALYLILQRTSHFDFDGDRDVSNYVPYYVGSRVVVFENYDESVRFLQQLTDCPEQLDWTRCGDDSRSNEGRNVKYAIVEIEPFADRHQALSSIIYERKQAALRQLTPQQRADLDLPDPDK